MTEYFIEEPAVMKAYENYLRAKGKTNASTIQDEYDFFEFVKMRHSAQFQFILWPLSPEAYERVTLLSKPHGWALLRAKDARDANAEM